jgi:polysaccharide deacetylase family protein (PEP-CTERM system associated)
MPTPQLPLRVLTVDLEDWFHLLDYRPTAETDTWNTYESRIRANTEFLLEELGHAGVRATFFSLGWVARQYPDLLQRLVKSGHEVGSHSDVHRLVFRQTPGEFLEDTRQSVRSIEDAVGQKVRFYRAPGFSITAQNPWAFDALQEVGIECDCSVFPAQHAHGGIQSLTGAGPLRLQTAGGLLRELPVTVRSLGRFQVAFAGGGYFRLLPWPLIRQWAAGSPYLMTYFHPRDFDPGQPVLKGLPVHRRFRSYVGLAGARAKLRRLLHLGSFMTVSEAVARTDWDSTPVVDVRTWAPTSSATAPCQTA